MNYYFCLACYDVWETQNTPIECPECEYSDIMSIKQTDYLGMLYDESCDCGLDDAACLAVWIDSRGG